MIRHRHLLNDLASMLPHGRKDAKFDSKSRLNELNELAELYNCNNVLFFEARKGQDLYVWLSKVPNGPTVKMHMQNCKWRKNCVSRCILTLLRKIVHTMEELHFTGNCLKGSRPILSFDAAFDTQPHLKVIKELFYHAFGVPQGARKSKPFVDHVMGFSVADGKIWVRNYQIAEAEKSVVKGADEKVEKDSDLSLIEIGPRFVLTPIVIQEGSFGGPIIYENKEFVSPNQVRSDLRKAKALRHTARAEQSVGRLSRKDELGLRTAGSKKQAVSELDKRKLFA